jgi:hypothetical protein
MAGERYVEVPAQDMEETLEGIGQAVVKDGGRCVRRLAGQEVVVDLFPPGGRAQLSIYTSMAQGADAVRGCGEDAIRLIVMAPSPEGPRQLIEPQKILRTAPRRAGDRVQAFLDRLIGEIRTAYLAAWNIPACPDCGAAMAVRERRDKSGSFYGCHRYPDCEGTRPMPKAKAR